MAKKRGLTVSISNSRQGFINGRYFETCIKDGSAYVCESHMHRTQKATFCNVLMGYYTPDGHQLILDGSSKFEELYYCSNYKH
jgi:hypothetical protein